MGNWQQADRDLSAFLRDIKTRCRGGCEEPPEWVGCRTTWRGACRRLRRHIGQKMCEAQKLTAAFETWQARAQQLRRRAEAQHRMGYGDLARRTLTWADRFWQRALRAAALAFEREARAEALWTRASLHGHGVAAENARQVAAGVGRRSGD